MRNGGFFMDSKIEIYNLIPKQFYPKTQFISQNLAIDKVETMADRDPMTVHVEGDKVTVRKGDNETTSIRG